MDCNTARSLSEFVRRPQEHMTAEDGAAVTAHLAECAACRQAVDADQQIDACLAQAMRAVPEPAGLRNRLLVRLKRERWRRLYVRIAAAAAVLLAVGGSVWYLQPRPVPVDLGGFIAHLEKLPTNAELAEQALGRPVQAPDDFNYGLLVHCDHTQFQGRLTPTLDFQTVEGRPGSPPVCRARVYILSDAEFDLKSLESNSLAPAGSYKIEVRRSQDGHYGYLILFTGDTLDPFLKPGATGA